MRCCQSDWKLSPQLPAQAPQVLGETRSQQTDGTPSTEILKELSGRGA